MDSLIRALLRPDAYPHPVAACELLETHISWVILTGDYAYKLKKPVNFGFVDFSTLERRRFCCEEELRLNRRLADDLYLAVQPVYGPRERASFVGSGEPIEFAVQMRQFSQSALLPTVLERGEVTPELIDRLAIDVAQFQQDAPSAGPDVPFGSPDAVRAPVEENFQVLEKVSGTLGSVPDTDKIVRQLHEWCNRECALRAADFAERKAGGRICEGHGDMHLGNMVLRRLPKSSETSEASRIEVFDCLEFNPSLRWIDVVSEVAFLVMDLADRRRPDLGWRFLNGWLERTGDYAGLSLWAWYYCYRALVRAKVAALRRGQADVTADEASRLERQLLEYLQLAVRATTPSRPRLIVTCGVSGSGKSHWSQWLAAQRGCVRIRSDVERKRLFGSPGTAVPGSLYSSETTALTYARLRDLAATVLRAGLPVIVDATFLQRGQRAPFRQLARELGVPSSLIEFTASPETLRQRLAARQLSGGDPSDATAEVMEQQLATQQSIAADEGWTATRIDTDRPDVEAALSQALDAAS
jgi:aminoglycoside phosphotransferase family enzyme/predicted kinase